MKIERDIQGKLICMAVMSLCFLGSGCATWHTTWGTATWNPLNDYLNQQAYNSDVQSYKSRGMSESDAERNAYEDQFFQQMHETADKP